MVGVDVTYIINVTAREKRQGPEFAGTLGRAVEIAMGTQRVKSIVEGLSVSRNVHVISIKSH